MEKPRAECEVSEYFMGSKKKMKYEGEFKEFLINNREKQHNILCYDEQRAQGQSELFCSPSHA